MKYIWTKRLLGSPREGVYCYETTESFKIGDCAFLNKAGKAQKKYTDDLLGYVLVKGRKVDAYQVEQAELSLIAQHIFTL